MRCHVVLVGLAGFLVLIGCGDSGAGGTGTGATGTGGTGTGATGTGGDGGTGAGGGNNPNSITPPAKDPAAPSAASGQQPVLAIRKMYMGDTTRSGAPSMTAWEQFGYDLDGKVSTAESTDLCKPSDGAAAATTYPDGDLGRDNSFGRNILPIMVAFAADYSAQLNQGITDGDGTVMLRLDDLGTAASENDIQAKLYNGAQFVDGGGMAISPAWDGTDAWPVRAESLDGGDLQSPLVQFPTSYVVTTSEESGARTWVSGTPATVKLTISRSDSGFFIPLTIYEAIITMELAADNNSATNGTIAGVLNTDLLIDDFAKIAGAFDPSLCPPSPTFESIATQLRQASDIGADGSQDPAKTCDGISIGLGFEMEKVDLGSVAPAVVPPDPCAE